MDAPIFLELNPETIIAEIIAAYEAESGRTLQPSQSERLLINAFAYREILVREQIQHAATQMLISFASAPALDYLAELVGVSRLAASGASCTLEFTLVSGHGGVVIPENTRVASSDGQSVFATTESVSVSAGVTTATVSAFSTTTGSGGNDYAAGEVNDILDPQPFIVSVQNTDTTAGGADLETDDELRERAKIAPAQFSTAGPVDAYKFFALSASPTIVDVAVTSSVPGTVNVWPLVDGGITTPPEIIALVESALNDEQVRPLSDTVVVASPTFVDYSINAELTIFEETDPVQIDIDVTAAIQAYADARAKEIGQDVTIAQLIALAIGDASEVYNVNFISPASDVVIAETEVSRLTSLVVNVTGTTDG